jgi:hypothetical protein
MNMTGMCLGRVQMTALADVLASSPHTVISAHYLRRGRCKAWTIGPPEGFEAAVVQNDELPLEPEGFGQPEELWLILKDVLGWDCVDVSAEAARPLAAAIERDMGRPCRLYSDLHHVLRSPVRRFPHPHVRLFGPEDTEFVNLALPKELGDPARFVADVEWAVFAGAVADGKIVAHAHTMARTGGFAMISVETCEAYRNLSYCTAAASLVAQAVQEAGEVPVWACGHTNAASRRVAQKLGFEPIEPKTYVIKGK